MPSNFPQALSLQYLLNKIHLAVVFLQASSDELAVLERRTRGKTDFFQHRPVSLEVFVQQLLRSWCWIGYEDLEPFRQEETRPGRSNGASTDDADGFDYAGHCGGWCAS